MLNRFPTSGPLPEEEYTHTEWWRRNLWFRYGAYFLSSLLEGFMAGTYIYGYGGGATILNLGILSAAMLTVAIFNIATGVLVGLGALYQAYQMKLAEEELREGLTKAIQYQKAHLSDESLFFTSIQKKYKKIENEAKELKDKKNTFENEQSLKLKHTLAEKLHGQLCDLIKIQNRLQIYEINPHYEPEIRFIQTHYQAEAQGLRAQVKGLKGKIIQDLTDLGLMGLIVDPSPSTFEYTPKRQSLGSMVWRGLLAFLCVGGTAVCTGLMMSGWGALVCIILGTILYGIAEQATKRIENKCADIGHFNACFVAHSKAAKEDLGQIQGRQNIWRLLNPSNPCPPSPVSSCTPARQSHYKERHHSPVTTRSFSSSISPPISPLRPRAHSSPAALSCSR